MANPNTPNEQITTGYSAGEWILNPAYTAHINVPEWNGATTYDRMVMVEQARLEDVRNTFNAVPPYHRWVQEPTPREPHQFPVAK